VSAPFDLGPLQECFAVEREAEELAAMQRRLSKFAATAHQIAVPVLLGGALIMGTICGIAQLIVLIRSMG